MNNIDRDNQDTLMELEYISSYNFISNNLCYKIKNTLNWNYFDILRNLKELNISQLIKLEKIKEINKFERPIDFLLSDCFQDELIKLFNKINECKNINSFHELTKINNTILSISNQLNKFESHIEMILDILNIHMLKKEEKTYEQINNNKEKETNLLELFEIKILDNFMQNIKTFKMIILNYINQKN